LSLLCDNEHRRATLEATPREVRFLEDTDGWSPYREWRDDQTPEVRGLLAVRLKKVGKGNLGDIKSVGEKVYELRFSEGPGWRIYIAQHPDTVYVLGGGTKRAQQADIDAAIKFWRKYGD